MPNNRTSALTWAFERSEQRTIAVLRAQQTVCAAKVTDHFLAKQRVADQRNRARAREHPEQRPGISCPQHPADGSAHLAPALRVVEDHIEASVGST